VEREWSWERVAAAVLAASGGRLEELPTAAEVQPRHPRSA